MKFFHLIGLLALLPVVAVAYTAAATYQAVLSAWAAGRASVRHLFAEV